MKSLMARRRPGDGYGAAGAAWALRLLAIGVGLVAVFAFPSGASASTGGLNPLGTWSSWSITKFSPSTGAFSGTDSDGPIEGTVTGSKLFFRTVPDNPYFRSVPSFVAIVIAMVAGVALSGFVTGAYHRARKHGKVPTKLEALPFGLLIAAMCVFVSRVTGFEPGYLYGIICGVSFTRKLAPSEEGHVVALGAWVRVVLAILAWFAWAAMTNDATKSGSFFGTVLVDDFLASLFVSSLVGTVISLFPLRFLPGCKLQAWHKGAWAVTFGISLFVLVQVLLRPHSTSSGPSHAPPVTTVLLFLLFGAGSLAFREHFARKRRLETTSAGKVAITDVSDLGNAQPAGVVANASHDGTQG